MKNVNANFFTCVGFQQYADGVPSFIGIYDSIVPKVQGDKYYIENFNVVLELSLIFSNDPEKDELKLDKEYEFKIWLSHVDSGYGITISDFPLCLTSDNLTKWCKNFYEATHRVHIPSIFLPKGMGNYALKLFIREKQEGKELPWIVQTIKKIVVGGSV